MADLNCEQIEAIRKIWRLGGRPAMKKNKVPIIVFSALLDRYEAIKTTLAGNASKFTESPFPTITPEQNTEVHSDS
jgi:hypothetical protein